MRSNPWAREMTLCVKALATQAWLAELNHQNSYGKLDSAANIYNCGPPLEMSNGDKGVPEKLVDQLVYPS